MQTNLFDQHYIGQIIIQCWLEMLSLASEDKNDAESRKFCCDSKDIKRIRNSYDRALTYIGLFRTTLHKIDSCSILV